jgi:hypothetical protein
MNLSDTFYVALCMTVLILGVVYFFWTQNQHLQRKLNLLENIVYETRSLLNAHPPEGLVDKALAAAAAASPSVAVSDYSPPEDDDDIVHEEMAAAVEAAEAAAAAGVSATEVEMEVETVGLEAFDDGDLPPGAVLNDGVVNSNDAAAEDLGTAKGTVLDQMTLKELKQLAEQKGVKGAKSMRKHELIEAIRSSKVSVSPFDIQEGTVSLE